MIDRTELLTLANELGLEPRVVEKDYILGWALAGIYHDPELARAWIFKGGTCLKKCFFETYRFSEDLDFTVTDEAQLDVAFLRERFTRLSAWLVNETGLELPPGQLRFDVYDNRGGRQAQSRIAYRGPIARRGGDLPRIKLDLTANELVVLAPVERRVNHFYSDEPAEGIIARCYTFDEVFGEKIRALGERARPRDLYDVINLFRNAEFGAIAARIRDVVARKCRFKNIPFPSLGALNALRDELAAEWENMLGHQLQALPPVDSFWGVLPEFFRWLMGEVEVTPSLALASLPLESGAEILRGPAGSIRIPGLGAPFIEMIRFAAANRLCVNLDYIDQHGSRSTRLIEPYSLRRTRAGDVLLYAVRVDDGQDRSYRLDRILGAQIVQRNFVPRYRIELTPAGSLVIPNTAQRFSSNGTVRPRSRASRTAQIYVFRCTVCGKEFERRKYDATLRPHKDRGGRDCYGLIGSFVRTKY